jgi:positive phototaxis protein PixI
MSTNPTLHKLQQLLPQLFQPIEIAGDPYLRFQLTPFVPALLSMERVAEAMLVPANSISPLPNMPAFTIGMINARDRVFCIVDLAQLIGVAAPLLNQQEYQVIVMNLPGADLATNSPPSNKLLGLAVSRVQGISRLSTGQWESVGRKVPEILTPYLKGCLWENNKQIVVMDTESILASPFLLSNSAVMSNS